jgi:hypothetical protein
VTPEKAQAVLRTGFTRQSVSEKSITDLGVNRAFVLMYIRKFGSEEDLKFWVDFFDRIVPKQALNRNNCTPSEDSYLHKLAAEYGGPARRKCREHLKWRPTISDYSEAMVFPEAPWTQSERDAAAQYAVSTNSRLLYTRSDVKRVVKRKEKKKNVTIAEIDNTSNKKRERKPKASSTPSKKKRKAAKTVKEADDLSISSRSTAESSFTYSLKSGSGSDLESNLFSDRDDFSVCSNYSTTDVSVLPTRMKHKDFAESFFNKVGKRFKDLSNNITYRIISVCRFDDPVGVLEGGKPLAYQLCFKYINDELTIDDVNDVDDIETSLCYEMLDDDCDWLEWLE